VELDRQAIERKDFPIGRRGYDPDAVDAHLRALAGEFEDVQRAVAHGSSDVSLASSAAGQVQSILEAAETAAGEIEQTALDDARSVREEADRDADHTREEALERARAHVAAVEQAAAGLLDRVGSMESEVSALVDSLRAGARRLASDLSAVESGMHELYDASAGRNEHAAAAPSAEPAPEPSPAATKEPAAEEPAPQPASAQTAAAAPAAAAAAPEAASPPPEQAKEPQKATVPGDIDGARLVALNMALNGESRAETERYLAENFELPDRLKLIDEVYAAVEG
jgi:DivIVA domain-containing protein